ncbi:MAG: transposase [Chloroflexi bacterium]|nr:transposase [Chloroflexota bacterium]
MSPLQPQYLNPYAKIDRHTNRLPHWQQDNATFFVTFRLADSLPAERLGQWRAEREAWLRWNPPPWSAEQEREYHERFCGAIERWLDEMHGSCVLRQAKTSRLVGDALNYFDGERDVQHAWVVMPNHVHTLFSLRGGWRLEKLLRCWKGFTAREINKLLGRQGELWQKDYFDRLVRDSDHFRKCIRYIRRNPEKAGLKPGEFLLYENDSVKSIA